MLSPELGCGHAAALGAPRYVRAALECGNVRYWHKADIPSCTAHVRYWV